MFLGLPPQPDSSEPSYMRKKRLFQQDIRKKERENLFTRLRKNAQLPNELSRQVQGLPEAIHQLIKIIASSEIAEWEESIAYIILHGKRQCLRDIFENKDLKQSELTNFLLFLSKKSNQEVSIYNECFGIIKKRSREWTYLQRIQFISVFNFMLQKGHTFILNDAEDYFSTMQCNRFFDNELKLYILILKKSPIPQHLNVFLPPIIQRRLSQQIGIHFYSDEEKIMMMEILIQILYLSPQSDVAKSFELDKIFVNLQYFFGFYNTNKMLIDRSILLIYNINIDATSERFVKHSCFKVVACEMKNQENPTKIRSLMAELYLNSIYHYPEEQFYRFLTSNLASIFSNFQYIIDEFSHQNDVKEMILGLLQAILSISVQQQKEDKVSNYIKSNPSFLKALRTVKQSQAILQQYGVLPQEGHL